MYSAAWAVVLTTLRSKMTSDVSVQMKFSQDESIISLPMSVSCVWMRGRPARNAHIVVEREVAELSATNHLPSHSNSKLQLGSTKLSVQHSPPRVYHLRVQHRASLFLKFSCVGYTFTHPTKKTFNSDDNSSSTHMGSRGGRGGAGGSTLVCQVQAAV